MATERSSLNLHFATSIMSSILQSEILKGNHRICSVRASGCHSWVGRVIAVVGQALSPFCISLITCAAVKKSPRSETRNAVPKRSRTLDSAPLTHTIERSYGVLHFLNRQDEGIDL